MDRFNNKTRHKLGKQMNNKHKLLKMKEQIIVKCICDKINKIRGKLYHNIVKITIEI